MLLLVARKISKLVWRLGKRFDRKVKARRVPVLKHHVNFLLWPEKFRGWRLNQFLGSVNLNGQMRCLDNSDLEAEDRIFLKAAVLLLHGRAGQALNKIDPLPESLRQTATSLTFQGRVFQRLGRPMKALDFFERGANASDSGVMSKIRYALALTQQNKWQEAEPIICAIENGAENWIEARYAAASYWAVVGDEKRAKDLIEKLEAEMGTTRRITHAKMKLATRFNRMDEAHELAKVLNYLVSENDMRNVKFFTV